MNLAPRIKTVIQEELILFIFALKNDPALERLRIALLTIFVMGILGLLFFKFKNLGFM
jgi:hypothetical protein